MPPLVDSAVTGLGQVVNLSNGSGPWGGQLRLKWNGATIVKVFCFDLAHSTGAGVCYQESGSPIPQVTWLLTHGYGPDNATTNAQAAAYQAAVWHYTENGVTCTGPSDVKAIYDMVVAACEAASPWSTGQNVVVTVAPTSAFVYFDDVLRGRQQDQEYSDDRHSDGRRRADREQTLTVTVISGPGTSDHVTVTTDSDGQATFTLTSTEEGTTRVRVEGTFERVSGTKLKPETGDKQWLVLGYNGTAKLGAEANITWVCNGKLIAHSFRDDNLNGVQDAGEPSLSGWLMRMKASSSSTWSGAVATDTNGNAMWDVQPGMYDVTEALPSSEL